MIHKVEKYIATNKLLKPGGKVLVGLSGGADSVALLIVLTRLGYGCEAMHCNFHLRGEESDRDEQFVKQLCERTGTALTVIHFDTTGYAKEKGISIEMAARELRYTAFEERRTACGADAIAVAHHRDDSAETLLLNLIRGTGIKGLRGIQPKNGHIVRPLLCVGRADIIDYLKWRGEDYVTDSTNLTTDYTRNKIRLELLPLMAEINPSVLESLSATAGRVAEAVLIYENAMEQAVSRVKEGNIIDIIKLKKEIAPQSILHTILSPLGFNSSQIENIAGALDAESGKQFHAPGHSLVKDRDRFVLISKVADIIQATELPAEGELHINDGVLKVTACTFDGIVSKELNIATLDTEKLRFPLTLRQARNGDRFAPFGMRGTRLVSDYLTDRKKSIIEKQQQLVVTDACGEIVWLVGERPAAPFCVNKNTKEVLMLAWKKA